MRVVRARWVLGVSMAAAVGALLVALVVGSWSQAEQPVPSAGVRDAHRFKAPDAGLGEELVSKRTATSRTYRGPGGTLRTLVSAAPVNYRDGDDDWRAIDTELKPDGQGGLVSRRAPSKVTLPGTLDDPAVVSDGSHSLSFTLQDAQAAPASADGSTATYDGALDGVDASYQALATGVKETLTLADAQAPSSFAFSLYPSAGLHPSLQADGAVVLRDGTGRVRFTIPAPTVKAADQAAASTDHVSYRLSEDGQTLTVVVDPQWLAGASFPVEVDPTVYAGGWDSCTLASGTLSTTSDCNGQWLKVGHDTGHTYRSVLRFDNADIPVPATASIIGAEVDLVITAQDDSNAITQIDAIGLEHQITDSATWSSYDGTNAWTAAGGDLVSDPQTNPNWMVQDYIPGWVGFDVSALAEGWIKDPSTNNGVLLKATDEGADNVITFGGQTYLDGGPTLVITYRPQAGLRADQTTTDIPLNDTNSLHVNVASGNLATQANDLNLPGAGGLNLTIGRVHNSANPGDHNGIFGSGWTETINGAAFVNSRVWYDDARTIYADGGSVYRFDRDYANDAGSTMAYTSPSGIDAELTADFSTGEATLTFGDGRVWTYAGSVDGYRFTLSRIDDGNGHHIDLHPDSGDPFTLASITDANNDTITLDHGVDGQLTEITDSDSHTWTYTDDDDLLTEVEDPDSNTTTYTYATDPVDRLASVTDTDGHITDLGYTADQITTITRHVDNDPDHDHDQVWSFDYDPDENAGEECDTNVGGHDVIGRTVVTDPDDQQTTYCYDNRPIVLQTLHHEAAAPTSTTAPTIVGTAREGETLEATHGEWDGDEPITYTYQWQRCDETGADCEEIEEATDARHEVTSDDLDATLKVTVTATNAAGSASETSAATAVVVVGPPRNDEAPLLEGQAVVGATLTATDGEWSFSDPLTFTRRWQRCDSAGALCHDIAGATGTNYTLTAADLRTMLKVVVTATGAAGATDAAGELSDLVGPPAPVNTVAPSISGDAADGATLTANVGTWSATLPVDYAYQWRRCDAAGRHCAGLPGEVDSSYALDSTDVGSSIRVVITADDGEEQTSASSAATAAIVARAPVNTTAPALSGTAVDGRQLTVSRGTWSGTEPFEQTFQWRRCDTSGANCQDIGGATGGTYTLRAADVGARLVAVVSTVNDVGSASATSAASDTVLGAAPANVVAPSISGTAMVGETVNADGDRWTGTNPAYTYQWRRCDSAGASCSDVSGATTVTYVLTSSDEDHTLRVVVTATNAVTATSATSAPSEVVLPDATFTAAISGAAAVPAFYETGGSIGILRAVPGDPGGTDPVTFRYQWQRCDGAGASCSDIDDEVSRTYAVQADDLGHRLRVVVTAIDDDSTVFTAISPATAAVVTHLAMPGEQVLPAVAGHPAVGSTVTTSPGDWPPTSTLTYAWQRCDADGVACSSISGATSATYVIQSADEGSRLAVAVTGTDTLGATTLISRPSEVVSLDSMVNTALPELSTEAGPTGTVLIATTGTWSSAASGTISYTYQWQRCDDDGARCIRLAGQDSSTYTLSAADVDHTVRALVVASDAGGRATARSEASDVVETAAPVSGTAPTTVGTAREGTILAAQAGTWTGVGTVDFGYQWRRCDSAGTTCTDIDDADGDVYTPQPADVGHRLRVAVTATNGEGNTTATSAATAAVLTTEAPGPGPEVTAAPTIDGDAIVGETLTADRGTWTGSGTITYTYQWQTCDPDGACFDIPGATGGSLELTSLQAGSLIRVLVTATASDGAAIAVAETEHTVASTGDIVLDAAPVITGTLEEGEELTVSQGAWTHTHSLAFDIQWQSCPDGLETCESIPAATEFTYIPSADDGRVRAAVSASDTEGHRVTALSAITDGVTAISPVALGIPATSGAPVTGETLHATAPSWDGETPIAETYQWVRCDESTCENIDDATDEDYVVGSADVGQTLEVEVTGTNDHGLDSARSEPTAIVTDADAPTAVTLPSIGGAAAVGQTLTAGTGTWTTTGVATYDYQWLLCDSDGDDCEPIDGETGDSLELGSGQLHATIRVVVTAHDDEGEATVRSAATAIVTETVPSDGNPIVNTNRPSVGGTPRAGYTLTADPGTWTGPADLSYQYRWRTCDIDGECAIIDGADDATFVPTTAEAGLRIGVLVTAVSGTGAVTVASDLTHAVMTGAPVRIGTPYLNYRDVVQGETVSVDSGTWSDPDATITLVWTRCDGSGASCTAISGATSEQYVLTAGDVGHKLRAVVTATNDLGSASYTTSPLGVVQGEIENVTPPTLTGDAISGTQLTLDYGNWNASVSTLQALWQRCDASGEDCVDLDVSSWDNAYTLTKADVGHTIKATVIAANAAGQVTLATDPSDVVVATPLPQYSSAPVLSGTAQAGSTLNLADGTWTYDVGTTDRDWLRCDSAGAHCHEIAGAHDTEYRVSRSDAGSRIRGLVTVTNAAGSTSARTAATTVVPTPPAVSSLTAPTIDAPWGVSAGNMVELETAGVWAGAPQTISYQWQRCEPGTTPLACTDIPDANDPYYNTYSQDVGFLLRLAETASDPAASPVTAYSTTTATPVSIAVNSTGDLSITGASAAGQTITAQTNAWTPVPMPQSIEYRFERFDGSTTTTVQDGSSASYELTDLDVGQQIIVTATITVLATDETTPLDSAEETATLSTIAERVTNDTAPGESGSTEAGSQLTATIGMWHGGGTTLVYAYSWQRCDVSGSPCADIDGATASTYRSTEADIGHPIRVKVIARPNVTGATGTAAFSASTDPIESGDAPVSTVAPTVSGEPAEGGELTAATGAWTSAAPIIYTYQWQRCDGDCEDIEDATGQHYTATSDDLGYTLRVVVTATNASGGTSAESGETDPIAVGALPALRSTPSMTLLGTPDPGSTLVTDGGEWNGAGEDDLSYVWSRCDWMGANCETIAAATAQSYVLVADDVDHQLKVTVTAGNDAGATQAASDLSEAIVASPSALMRGGADPRTSAADTIVYYDNQPDPGADGDKTPTLRLVDQDGGDPTTVATCSELTGRTDCELGHPRISPNHKMISVENHPIINSFARTTNGGSGIYLINYDGSRPRYLADGYDPVWSADGLELLYTQKLSGGENRAMVVRADGRRTDRPTSLITFNGRFANTPEVATDRSVVFAGRRASADGNDLYVRGAEDKSPHRIALPSRFANAYEPRFTADETAITFMANMSDDWDKGLYDLASGWKVNVDGSGLTRMTPDDNQIYAPGAAGTEKYTTAASSYRCQNYNDDGVCGNVQVYGGRLMVGSSDGTNLVSLGIGTIDNPVHEPSPAPSATAAANVTSGALGYLCVPDVVWEPSGWRWSIKFAKKVVNDLRHFPHIEIPTPERLDGFPGSPAGGPPPILFPIPGVAKARAAAVTRCSGPFDQDPPCVPRSPAQKGRDCGAPIWKVYLGFCRVRRDPGPWAMSKVPAYVGRTSQSVSGRASQHLGKGRCFGGHVQAVIPDNRPVPYIVARGVEQALIEHYGFRSPGYSPTRRKYDVDTSIKMPLGDDGRRRVGTLENASHGIQPSLPWYLGAVALGEQTLVSRGRFFEAVPTYGFYWCGDCNPQGLGAKLLKTKWK